MLFRNKTNKQKTLQFFGLVFFAGLMSHVTADFGFVNL